MVKTSVMGCCGVSWDVLICAGTATDAQCKEQPQVHPVGQEDTLRDTGISHGKRPRHFGDIQGGTGTHGREQGLTEDMGTGTLAGNRVAQQWTGTLAEGQGHTSEGQ